MTLAILTTPVASYTVPEHLVRHWRERVIEGDDSTLEIYNAMGERIQSHGALHVVPAIWTHTPVPLGFPIEAIHERFEKHATALLGDAESTPDFSTHSPSATFPDNRYADHAILCAWIMYLDLAISYRQ